MNAWMCVPGQREQNESDVPCKIGTLTHLNMVPWIEGVKMAAVSPSVLHEEKTGDVQVP